MPTLKKSDILRIAITLAMGSFLFWLILTPPSKSELLPQEPPSEKFRVRSTNGFSIIVPKSWDTRVTSGAGARIRATSPGGKFRRPMSVIIVEEVGQTAPTLNGGKEIQFQHKNAILVVTHLVFDEHGHDARSDGSQFAIFCERNGMWYRLLFSVTVLLDELPEPVMEYLESFSVE